MTVASEAPGLATDSLSRASFSIERRVAGCTVVETPVRRDYWFGNCLILDRPPKPAAYDAWLARHATIFGGMDVKRHVVQWEVGGPRTDPEPPDRPDVELEVLTVMISDSTPLPVNRDDVAIHRVATADDWSQIDALERASSPQESPGFADFYSWRTSMVRLDVETGRASVYGAFVGATLVAYAGCYGTATWIRLTTPVTACAYRRRGLFSALFSRAIGDARARFPLARIVVVAAADSPPERLYRSLGFEACGHQYALIA
jgi:hypothetical protein